MHNLSQSNYSQRDFHPLAGNQLTKPGPLLASVSTLLFPFKLACCMFLRISYKTAS